MMERRSARRKVYRCYATRRRAYHRDPLTCLVGALLDGFVKLVWLLVSLVLTIAGLIQGQAWINGETVYRVLPQIHPYYIVRVMLGLTIAVGAYIGLYNIIRSIFYTPGETA